MPREVVLIIEDNKINMLLVTELLSMAGFDARPALNAEEGIKLARELKPALILMDVALPGMDGLDATRLLKKDPDTKNIPVVALTAYAMNGDEEKAREAGCIGYITKPIDTRSFANTIRKYLLTES